MLNGILEQNFSSTTPPPPLLQVLILLTALFSTIKRRLVGEKYIKIFGKGTFEYSPNQKKP